MRYTIYLESRTSRPKCGSHDIHRVEKTSNSAKAKAEHEMSGGACHARPGAAPNIY
jgi:hypothetical protein